MTVNQLIRPWRATGFGKLRVGNLKGDGGYVMLDDLARVAMAISAGIGNDVSWDLDIAERGIDVVQVDPYVRAPPVPHHRFRFFQDRMSFAGALYQCPALGWLIVKIDVEGDEWRLIGGAQADELKRMAQLIVEFHGFADADQGVLAKLDAAFRPVHVHGNNYGPVIGGFPDTVEVTYASRERYRFEPETSAYPTPLDRPNDPAHPDLALRF